MNRYDAQDAIGKLVDLERAVRKAQWKLALAKNALPLDLQYNLDAMTAALYLNALPDDPDGPHDGLLYDVGPLVRHMAQYLPDLGGAEHRADLVKSKPPQGRIQKESEPPPEAGAQMCLTCGGHGFTMLDGEPHGDCPDCYGKGTVAQ